MTKNTHNTMLKFSVNGLADLFTERFILELGMVKAQEIGDKINTSQKVNNYLSEVGLNFYRPTSKGILSVLNTIPYFMFSKGETLCFGALLTLINWNNLINGANTVLGDDEVTSVAADLIIYCYGTKLNKHDSIFSRFFTDVDKMEEESEEPDTPSSNFWGNNYNSNFWGGDEFDYGERLD